jgi:hypothetical protein
MILHLLHVVHLLLVILLMLLRILNSRHLIVRLVSHIRTWWMMLNRMWLHILLLSFLL